MNKDISKDQWDELDLLIIENRKMEFHQLYRKITDCSINDVTFALGERYRILNKVAPEKLKLTEDKYWDGFYS